MNSCIKLIFSTVLLLALSSAVAGDRITTMFPSVTQFTCFGTEIAEKDEDSETSAEADICLIGIVTGLVLLIALYPTVGLLGKTEGVYDRYVRGDQEFPGAALRRGDQAAPEFLNPAQSVQNPTNTFYQRHLSLGERFSRAFDNIRDQWSLKAPFGAQQQQQQQQYQFNHQEQAQQS